MRYPKMPEKFNRAIKLTKADKEKIRKEYLRVRSCYALAKKYKVSHSTIWLVVNPEKYKKAIEKRVEEQKIRRKTDIEYVEKERIRNAERRKYKRRVQPELKRYYGERQKPEYWKRHNKKRWAKIKSDPKLLREYRERINKWADKNREHKNRKARENYHKRNLTH